MLIIGKEVSWIIWQTQQHTAICKETFVINPKEHKIENTKIITDSNGKNTFAC
jgi:hypothetical protein